MSRLKAALDPKSVAIIGASENPNKVGGRPVHFRDTTLLLPPFSNDDAREALERLRIAPLFAGVRGEPPMDVDALCDTVVRIGELMLDPSARVMSLDLNPVLLDSAGNGCMVVDAVVFQG